MWYFVNNKCKLVNDKGMSTRAAKFGVVLKFYKIWRCTKIL